MQNPIEHLKRQAKARILALMREALERAAQKQNAELAALAKAAPAAKIAQRELFIRYQSLAKAGTLPSIDDTGYRVYSQFDEDGIFVFLFAVAGTANKTFVDIGASDGINSNCANLAINFGWHGLFIDGNAQAIAHGEQFYQAHPDTFLYPPRFVSAMVNRSNINAIISGAGFSGEIDLVSIDIDGNDYWIWDALECVHPRVVCIETHIEFGMNDVVVPYDENYVYPGKHPDYHGASPVAMANLAKRKGYRLVGANLYGFNTIYVRSDLAPDLIPAVTVEHILRHPRNAERFKLFEAIQGMPYLYGYQG